MTHSPLFPLGRRVREVGAFVLRVTPRSPKGDERRVMGFVIVGIAK